jgi:hypothetical protein
MSLLSTKPATAKAELAPQNDEPPLPELALNSGIVLWKFTLRDSDKKCNIPIYVNKSAHLRGSADEARMKQVLLKRCTAPIYKKKFLSMAPPKPSGHVCALPIYTKKIEFSMRELLSAAEIRPYRNGSPRHETIAKYLQPNNLRWIDQRRGLPGQASRIRFPQSIAVREENTRAKFPSKRESPRATLVSPLGGYFAQRLLSKKVRE